MLTVAGSVSANSVNATTTYQIGGNNILSTAGRQNLFLGQQAGQNNTSGVFNVFAGYHAGSSNTTGGENSFFGHEAGNLNATGSANTFLGNIAGQKNASGADNTFLGARAGANNTSGNNNIFAGFVAGHNNTTGSQNVFLGNGAGQGNTIGQNNTLVGWASGSSNVTGTDNVYLGYTAGQHATGSNNIYLGEISSSLERKQHHPRWYNSSLRLHGRYLRQPTQRGTAGGGQLQWTIGDDDAAKCRHLMEWSDRRCRAANWRLQLLPSQRNIGEFSTKRNLQQCADVLEYFQCAGNGSGLTGVLPAAGSPYYIQNGTTQQTGASLNIAGSGTVGGALNGNVVNSTSAYQLSGSNVLSAFC